MWCKIPWKKEQNLKFINLFSNKTDGYHGNYWLVRYRKTFFLKIEIIAAFLAIILNVSYIILSYQFIWYLFSIFVILVNLFYRFRKIDSKFLNGPPEGRYTDYRKIIAYLSYF